MKRGRPGIAAAGEAFTRRRLPVREADATPWGSMHTSAAEQGSVSAGQRLFTRIDNGFGLSLSVVSSAWIFAIMVLVCVDILMRNLLNAPISGVAEFIALSVPACVFLQLPSTISQHRLVRAELIIENLEAHRPKVAALFNATYAVVGAYIFWKILVWAWPDFLDAWATGEFAGAQGAYTIPVWPFKLTLLIGTFFGLLQFIKKTAIELVAMLRTGPAGSADTTAKSPLTSLVIAVVFLAAIAAFVAFMFIENPRPLDVGVYCLGAMLVLVLLGMPIPLVLMALAYLGIWIARSGEFMAINTLGLAASSAVASYEFGVIPLFIMMGLVLEKADVGRDAFRVAASLLRRLRGGLGMATVFANAIFASIVGSSIASAAVFSRIAVPEMVKHGYSKRFSVGCVAGSSVLGMLIPPSLLLIIYGLIAEESVGKLFIAAVVPGILLATAFALSIYVMTWVAPRFIGDVRSADDIGPSSFSENSHQARANRDSGRGGDRRHLWRPVHADRGGRCRCGVRIPDRGLQAAARLDVVPADRARDRLCFGRHPVFDHRGKPLHAAGRVDRHSDPGRQLGQHRGP